MSLSLAATEVALVLEALDAHETNQEPDEDEIEEIAELRKLLRSKRTNINRIPGEHRELIVEALDSLVYWELSDEHYRNDGFVYGEGSDDPETAEQIKTVNALHARLEG